MASKPNPMEWKWVLLAFGLGLCLLPLGFLLLFLYLKRRFAALLSQVSTPHEIQLQPLDKPQWKSDQLGADSATLVQMGFRSLGAYAIPQMPGVQLSAWIHQSDGMYGVLYDHPAAGCWCDITSFYADDVGCTHSSAPESGLDPYPKSLGRKLPGESVAQVVEAHRRERPPGWIPLQSEGFVSLFQDRYRAEMEWRAGKGTSREEIARVAKLQGKEYDPEVLDQAFEVEQQRNRELLEEALRQQFLETTSLSAAEWKKVEDQLVFVYDRLTPEQMSQLSFEPQPQGTPRNWARASGHRYLGSVEQPVEADVYAIDLQA